MTIISAGDTGVADLPEISNSLRFDGSNDHLSRTFSASGTTATFSFWTKRSVLGTIQNVFGWSNGSTQSYGIQYNADNTLDFNSYSSGYTARKTTTAVYRDPSAWQHVLCVQDTTNATAADRIRIYIDGVRVTSFLNSVDPAQNTSLLLSGSTGWTIGVQAGTGSYFFGGYLANFCLIDGQAKNPSDFAYTDPNGQWRSLNKAALQSVVNAGGANSFFLSFDDGSSTTTLGADASSKGNNWTLTNMVRDGSVNDCWSYDTPTNNFAVLNPLDINPPLTLSLGNLRQKSSSTGWSGARSSIAVSSGKWYAEVLVESGTGGVEQVSTGIQAITELIADSCGNSALSYGWNSAGNKFNNSVGTTYNGTTYTNGDVIGIALDLDSPTLTFYKNGVSQGVAYSPVASSYCFYTTVSTNPQSYTDFGQRPVASGQWYSDAGGYFRYAPPTGFKALCRKNLPDGTVTTSGSFTGNVSTDGPFIWLNGTPTAMTINGNAVTFGTHADKLANGFKVRSSSTSYNSSGSNTYSVTSNAGVFRYNNAEGNP